MKKTKGLKPAIKRVAKTFKKRDLSYDRTKYVFKAV